MINFKAYYINMIGIIGLILYLVSINGLYLGQTYEDIPTNESLLEEIMPYTYWLSLILVSSSIFLHLHIANRTSYYYILFFCILLMIFMRSILTFAITEPFAYDVINQYVPWIKTWIYNGVKLMPSHLSNEALIQYYPNSHPISFIFSYVFIVLTGIPINSFFKFAPFLLYIMIILLSYCLAIKISDNIKISVMSAFLISISTHSQVITSWYSPQLYGFLLLMLSLYICFHINTMKKRYKYNYLMHILNSLIIFVLITTHHISTILFISVNLGIYTLYYINKKYKTYITDINITPYWIIYPIFVWYIYASIVYPNKLFYWINNVVLALKGTPVHGFYAVNLSNFINMPIIDKIAFLSYPLLILILILYELINFIHSGIHERNRLNNVIITPIGMIVILSVLFFIGIFLTGITYPLRIFETICIFLSPLAAKSLNDHFLSIKFSYKKFVMILFIICLIILNTHWIFRITQRTIPSWISEYWF